MPYKVNALVLAGAPNEGGLSAISDVDYEALIEINGKTILEYVLTGILQADNISNVVVVGPSEISDIVDKMEEKDRIQVVQCGKEIVENVMIGVAQLPENEYAMVFTSDIPFVTGSDIDSFIKECFAEEAQVYYPIISQDTIEKSFPGAKRTYFSLKEGNFTAGNVFMANSSIVKSNEELIKKVFNLRKNPAGIASLLGAGVIMKFLTKSLSVVDIEARVLNSFEIKGKGVISNCASIGMDVDKPEDFELALKIL